MNNSQTTFRYNLFMISLTSLKQPFWHMQCALWCPEIYYTMHHDCVHSISHYALWCLDIYCTMHHDCVQTLQDCALWCPDNYYTVQYNMIMSRHLLYCALRLCPGITTLCAMTSRHLLYCSPWLCPDIYCTMHHDYVQTLPHCALWSPDTYVLCTMIMSSQHYTVHYGAQITTALCIMIIYSDYLLCTMSMSRHLLH